MPHVSIRDLAFNYRNFAVALERVAAQYPDASVMRNEAGNLAITYPSGSNAAARQRVCIGYIDVLTGEIDIFM